MSEFTTEWIQRWKAVQSQPSGALLRLALLRDYARKLHAERSACMATGNAPRGHQIESLEAKLAWLRTRLDLIQNANEPDLLLQQITPPNSSVKETALPKRLTSLLPAEKLNRYDRAWERALAVEALKAKWCFWSADHLVRLDQAEHFHQELTDLLWPDGLILYVESGGGTTPPQHWNGRWVGTAIDLKRIESRAPQLAFRMLKSSVS